ncbi:MAG: hypothetical protein ACTSYB_01755, partial [Candidatus Helarchaeota archaeon]
TKKYLQMYAPDKIKFEITEEINSEIKNQIMIEERKALEIFIDRFENNEWEEKSLEQEIYSIGKETLKSSRKMFQILYKILLGKKSGPKLAPLLLIMDKNWVIQRIQDALT